MADSPSCWWWWTKHKFVAPKFQCNSLSDCRTVVVGREMCLIKDNKQYVGNEIRGYVKAYIIASVRMYVWRLTRGRGAVTDETPLKAGRKPGRAALVTPTVGFCKHRQGWRFFKHLGKGALHVFYTAIYTIFRNRSRRVLRYYTQRRDLRCVILEVVSAYIRRFYVKSFQLTHLVSNFWIMQISRCGLHRP